MFSVEISNTGSMEKHISCERALINESYITMIVHHLQRTSMQGVSFKCAAYPTLGAQ